MMITRTIHRAMSTSAIRAATTIENVTVIGAGIMGSGIAQTVAQRGYKVTLVDQNDDILNRANDDISKSLTRIAKRKFGDDKDGISKAVSITMNNISLSKDVEAASVNTDLVVEAIIENKDIKRELFARIDKVAPHKTIFASNTSSYLIGSLAEVTNRRDRFVGLHFFNPVPVMKLLELVFPDEVSVNVKEEITQFGKQIGKVTIQSKDTYGFIVNKLLVPHMFDGVMMAERGDATIEDIDTAMKLGCGYPMGVFQLIDFSGIDTFNHVIKGWMKDHPEDTRFKYSKLVEDKVKDGKLGLKTGEGFYKYKK